MSEIEHGTRFDKLCREYAAFKTTKNLGIGVEYEIVNKLMRKYEHLISVTTKALYRCYEKRVPEYSLPSNQTIRSMPIANMFNACSLLTQWVITASKEHRDELKLALKGVYKSAVERLERIDSEETRTIVSANLQVKVSDLILELKDDPDEIPRVHCKFACYVPMWGPDEDDTDDGVVLFNFYE